MTASRIEVRGDAGSMCLIDMDGITTLIRSPKYLKYYQKPTLAFQLTNDLEDPVPPQCRAF